MIKWLRQLLADWRHEKQLRICRTEGHYLIQKGDGREGEMSPTGAVFPTGPVSLWIMVCKCGYGEINKAGVLPYYVSYEDGEKKKRAEASGQKQR